jgi:hypothetical protein
LIEFAPPRQLNRYVASTLTNNCFAGYVMRADGIRVTATQGARDTNPDAITATNFISGFGVANSQNRFRKFHVSTHTHLSEKRKAFHPKGW